MFAFPALTRNLAARFVALLSILFIASCDVVPMPVGTVGGPAIDPSRPVPVALLVPGGSGNATDALLAKHLENAARLAAADLRGAKIDLRVYNTAGNAQLAANVATQAVNDGAKIILGPLYGEAANAAGLATASRGVNVLSFSNTGTIAGGNVFVMGSLYDSIADRLVKHAARQGVTRYFVVGAHNLQGELGIQATTRAVTAAGGQVVGSKTYALSQQDIILASDDIVAAAKAAGAQAIVLTANPGAELAILGSTLPQKGLLPTDTQYIGLTRWNATPEMLDLPGLQGGLFALPDTARQNAFEARYQAAYGEAPHPLAGLAYDGVAAIGALAASGNRDALSHSGLTRRAGFVGTGGIFRFTANGRNQRGLAVATIKDGQVQVISPAPTSFADALN